MAEIVEQRIQRMIPEVEEMERIGLLSTEEIKKLIQDRRDFEYRISRPFKKKDDFISYVLFDWKLLELIALRRQKIAITEKYQQIEQAISRRNMKRLRYMSRVWPSHTDVWELRISFAKSKKFADEVSTAYVELVRFQGNDEDIWVKWAQWEIEGRSNFEKARSILLSRAPLYHPDSLILTREYFRLELLYVEHLKKKSEQTNIEGLEEITVENREKILNCVLPETIYKNAVQKFDTPNLFLEFYFIAEKFKFAHHLQKKIYRDAITKYENEEIVYRLQAKRSLNGISYSSDEEESGEPSKETRSEEKRNTYIEGNVKSVDFSPKEKLLNILLIYDKAIQSIGYGFLKSYVEELCDLLYQCWGLEDYVKVIVEKLFEIFNKFSHQLSNSYFLLWYLIAVNLKKPTPTLKKILFAAKASHPSCPLIKFHWIKLRLILKPNTIYNQRKFLESVSGTMGVKLCMAIINHDATKASYKEKMFQKAAFHTDVMVAKWMRINHIDSYNVVEEMKRIRSLYKSYCFLPPFSAELHVCMILKELSLGKVCQNRVRNVFKTAVEQFGHSHVGVWLCFIEFEKKFGDKKNIPNLNQEAEQNLDIRRKQDLIDLKFYIQNMKTKKNSECCSESEHKEIFIEQETTKEDLKECFWKNASTLGPIFAESPVLMYSAVEERKNMFHSMTEVMNADINEKKTYDDKAWEPLLTFFLGEPISLLVKKVDAAQIGVQHETKEYLEKSEKQFNNELEKRRFKLSDTLSTSKSTTISTVDKELEKILQSSEILQPGFLQQKQIVPYYLSKRTQKSIKKKKRAETKGEGWFHMKAPELTEEVQRDLAVLKMRSVLHPDRHYKRNDMKETPTYFQLGKVVDTPLDYYSSRVSMKERKKTLADEIMHDEDVLRYQKRKYTEIVERRDQHKRKRSEAAKELSLKKKTKEVAKKSTKIKPKPIKRQKTFKYSQDE